MSSIARVTLGTAAVLSVEEAAAWLPMDAASAERWLRSTGIVRLMRAGDHEVEVVVWGDVVEAIRSDPAEGGPLTTWRAIALAIGVSEDTVARRRTDAGDRAAPYFVDRDAARTWYQGLVAPRPVAKPTIKRARPPEGRRSGRPSSLSLARTTMTTSPRFQIASAPFGVLLR